MSQQIEVRLTVFQDEDPDLYAWLSSLPPSRGRRRAAYREVMKAGLLVKGDPSLLAAALPVPSAPVVASQPVNTVVAAVSQGSDPDASSAPVVLAQEDLDEIFGPK